MADKPFDSREAGAEKNPGMQDIAKIKKPLEQPKLTFIQPRLTKHGDATKVTQNGFFGTFEP